MWKKAGTEEFNEIRNLLFTTAESRLTEEVGGKPCFVEETGTWRPIAADPDGIGAAVRGMLWNLWANNCRGFLWWCAFDQDSFDIAPYDWVQPGLEHGILTADRKAHPAAESMKRFGIFWRRFPSGVCRHAKRTRSVCWKIRKLPMSSAFWRIRRESVWSFRRRAHR